LKIGDLVVSKYDSHPKPQLITASCYDEDGQWVQVESFPDTWFMATNFEIISVSSYVETGLSIRKRRK
tara:strand:- start:3717 stop:3920 length:204 start_codon:yes stop_codon:yes gene_type:complete